MTKVKNFGVFVAGLIVLGDAEAGARAESFVGIADRNVFRINPPKPDTKPIAVQPELPQISLQGVTRILGSPQALLRIQVRTKPATIEDSCILGEGQSHGGVVVSKIDVDSGTVWLTNQGVEQVLALKQ